MRSIRTRLFFDGLEVPVEHRIGEEGKGFRYILDSLNPERILNAAEVVGMGRRALDKAVDLRRRARGVRPADRQEPVDPAPAGGMLVGALRRRADDPARGRTLRLPTSRCGAQANAAKYLAADAGFRACDRAIRTHGGMGYAAEYHVERYFREMVAMQLAPVSREMILDYIAERELGLPKSY